MLVARSSPMRFDNGRLFDDIVRALSLALDMDQGHKLFHAWRVGYLARLLADRLTLPEASVIFHAGLLHDIGGMGLNDHVVHAAAAGFVDPQARNHSAEGARILRPLAAFGGLASLVADHHERFDGRGFPDGKSGDEIAPGSYVIALADEAELILRSTQPSDQRPRLEGAISKGSGKAWPHAIADAALELLAAEPGIISTLMSEPALREAIESQKGSAVHLGDVDPIVCMSQLLWVFARAIDVKHRHTMGHSVRVTLLAHCIACALGEEGVNDWDVVWAGLLHDVGKVGVPRQLLDKSGELTEAERLVVQKHASDSMVIISSIRDLARLAYPAAAHHEFYDGNGYPLGLAGEEIPLIGRILAFADAYDAMRSTRAYRQAMTHVQAIERIRTRLGTQFDPHLGEIALPVLDKWGQTLPAMVEHDDFLRFFEADKADIRRVLGGHGAGGFAAGLLPENPAALAVESEPWQTAEFDHDGHATSGVDEVRRFTACPSGILLSDFFDSDGGVRLREWLAKGERRPMLSGHFFSPAGRAMEVIVRRGPAAPQAGSAALELLYRSAENRFRTMKRMALFYRNFLSSTEAAFFTSPDGGIIDVNPTFLTRYGYKLREVTGLAPSIFDAPGGGERSNSTFFPQLIGQLQTGALSSWDGELITHTAKGEAIPTLATIALVRDSTRAVMGFAVRLVDISARKRLETELATKNKELSDLSRLKSDLVAITSHDLRSPLAGVVSYARLLRDSLAEGTPRKVTDHLGRIESLGQHGLRLISDILNLEKIESGTFELDVAPTRVDLVLNTCIERLQVLAHEKGLRLVLDVAAPVRLLIADARRLEQVFSNILSNAIKFSPENVAIDVRCADSGTHLLVVIRDYGPGVPEQEIDRIFERYHQAKNQGGVSRRSFGTGLGLHIARSIVAMHQGRIWAENHPGGGCFFCVELPVRALTLPAEMKTAMILAQGPAAEQLADQLRGLGILDIRPRDKEETLRMAEAARPRIIFSSVGLSDEAGLDLRAVQGNAADGPLHVGLVDHNDIQQAEHAAGARLSGRVFQRYLSLPALDIELRELLDEVRLRSAFTRGGGQ